jgi:hypothetical protein
MVINIILIIIIIIKKLDHKPNLKPKIDLEP